MICTIDQMNYGMVLDLSSSDRVSDILTNDYGFMKTNISSVHKDSADLPENGIIVVVHDTMLLTDNDRTLLLDSIDVVEFLSTLPEGVAVMFLIGAYSGGQLTKELLSVILQPIQTRTVYLSVGDHDDGYFTNVTKALKFGALRPVALEVRQRYNLGIRPVAGVNIITFHRYMIDNCKRCHYYSYRISTDNIIGFTNMEELKPYQGGFVMQCILQRWFDDCIQTVTAQYRAFDLHSTAPQLVIKDWATYKITGFDTLIYGQLFPQHRNASTLTYIVATVNSMMSPIARVSINRGDVTISTNHQLISIS